MKQRHRIFFLAARRAEIWDRWQAVESMKSIGRRFDRGSSSVFSVISPAGGIRPAERRRAPMVLSLGERDILIRLKLIWEYWAGISPRARYLRPWRASKPYNHGNRRCENVTGRGGLPSKAQA